MRPVSMTINGEAVGSDQIREVINPAAGEPFIEVSECTPAQLDAAVSAAAAAQPSWSSDLDVRRDLLRRAATLLRENVDELAALITSEQGKPLGNANIEVRGAARWIRYFAELDMPRDVIQDDDAAFVEVIRRPVGPTAAITPWNFPITTMAWKIAPALLAGNTVVVKPSPFTPVATLRVGELLREVFPPGVLNVVSGGDHVGAWLSAHPGIRKVSFTGSTAAGRKIAVAGADDFKRLTLELGGNDAAIVLDDVDPAALAERLFWAAFDNNGQVCTAVKRLYVHESGFDDMVEALADLADNVVVGDGFDPSTQLGPINNARQRDRVAALVGGALARGGRAVTGGRAIDRPGYFYAPTIVTGLDDDEPLVAEEQFGPALPVLPYRDVDDAVRRANDTHFGLGASVWSSEPERARMISSRLEAGMTWVNTHLAVAPAQPFGGIKSSGIGVENGTWGFEAYTDVQMVHEARS